MKDCDGKYIGCNTAFTNITGVSNEVLRGKTAYEVWPGELAEVYHHEDMEQLKAEASVVYEFKLKDKYGDVRPVVYAKEIFRDKKGQAAGILGTFVDISDIRKVEKSLEHSERKYKLLFETSREPFFLFMHGQGFIDCNQAMVELFEASSKEELCELEVLGALPEYQPDGVLSKDHMTRIASEIEDSGVTSFEWFFTTLKGRNFWGSVSLGIVECEEEIIYQGRIQDITAYKEAKEAIEKRLVSLTQPLEGDTSVTFEDLFNLEEIQKLQDDLSDAIGVASLITKPDGTPLTAPSNFCRFCRDLVRKSEKGCENCHQSDSVLGGLCKDGPIMQICKSGGLWDAGAGISVGGKHIASWLMGQVRNEAQNEESIRVYARKIDVNEDELVKAFYEVPSMSREKFDKVAQALFTLAQQLSDIAYQNVQQARFIADREKAEHELRESEEKYRLMIEHTGQMVYDYDFLSGDIKWSGSIKQLTGFGYEEFQKVNFEKWSSLIHEQDRKAALDLLDETIANFGMYKMEYRFQCKDGSYIFMEDRGNCLKDENGQAYRMLGSMKDISDRKIAEQERIQLQNYLSNIIDSMPSLLIGVDAQGKVTQWNKTAVEMSGISIEQALGKSLVEIFPRMSSEMNDVLDSIRSGEVRQKRKLVIQDGSYEDITIYPLAGGVKGAVIRIDDVTEKVQQEENMLQNKKMVSLGQLAGGIAHDFNNMLAGIIGASEVLLNRKIEENQKKCVDTIIHAADRAADLTNKLLAFSRKSDVINREVNCHKVLEESINLLSHTIDKRVKIRKNLLAESFILMGDVSTLQNIFINLGVNAGYAMEGGGQLSFSSENVTFSEDDKEVINYKIKPGLYIHLSVKDNGCGMSQEVLDRIFEPFFTTREQGKGTGLGLAAVYGTVKDMKGVITVESKEGSGTIFHLYFPLIQGKSNESKKELSAEKKGSATILVIEDEEILRMTTQALLEDLNHTVVMAGSATDGIKLYKDHIDEIDLILLDMIMPDMNGEECFHIIRDLNPEVKIVLNSGYSRSASLDSLLEQGNCSFIKKPYRVKDMQELICNMLS
jgi:PAS domain S-box-containing protein